MTIIDERAKTYGDPATNLGRIAGLWTAYLDHSVTAHDVAQMMVLVKISRSKADPGHADNYTDARGYTDLAEMLQ